MRDRPASGGSQSTERHSPAAPSTNTQITERNCSVTQFWFSSLSLYNAFECDWAIITIRSQRKNDQVAFYAVKTPIYLINKSILSLLITTKLSSHLYANKGVSHLHNGIHFILAVPVWLIHVRQTCLYVLWGLVHSWWQWHMIYRSEMYNYISRYVHAELYEYIYIYMTICISIYIRLVNLYGSLRTWNLSLLPGMPSGPSGAWSLQPEVEM